ncbi:MAG: hypothetical protein U0169_12830 [Polyangiaceae bacterium]
MSVASWLQPDGTSAPSILKTMDPSGLVMVLERRSYTTASSGLTLGDVYWRGTDTPPTDLPFVPFLRAEDALAFTVANDPVAFVEAVDAALPAFAFAPFCWDPF